MSVEFEEGQSDPSFYQSRQLFGAKTTPGMINWLVNKKIVKNENRAARLLGVFVTLMFLLSIAITLYAMDIIPNASTLNSEKTDRKPVPYSIWKKMPPQMQKITPYE